MTVRFAAPPGVIVPRISIQAINGACAHPANDNGNSRASDTLLHAALRHFAQYGLRAAHSAGQQAEAALLANDEQGYRWWLDICRTLDRQMALEFASRMAKSN